MKAKPIDRLELTRRKFSNVNNNDQDLPNQENQENQELQGLQECPMCKNKSLKLDGGCMSCLSCGWSACG